MEARPLESTAERRAAAQLYRSVFGLGATDPAVAPKLLCALARHGGSAVGAFDGDRLVGFAYGFTGLDEGLAYHHSQAAVVERKLQGTGVGRLLKHAQADVARATGVSTMRWAYDPLEARNAHFNLDVLGATGIRFHRAYFGSDFPGADRADRADRVIVEWPLEETAAPELPVDPPDGLGWGDCVEHAGEHWLAVPAGWAQVRSPELRDRVAAHLERLVGRGDVLRSCRRVDPTTAVYRIGHR
ncbi:GNAT family N-acetyltransferase [Actinomycetes bacterium KLBMP 9759]